MEEGAKTLNQYLAIRKRYIKECLEEINLLEELGSPSIEAHPLNSFSTPDFIRGACFISQDFTLANNVKIINKRVDKEDHSDNGPWSNASYCIWNKVYFPEFFYKSPKEQERLVKQGILMKIGQSFEPDFDEAIFCIIENYEGSGHYSYIGRASILNFPNSLEEICERYRELGVKENVLKSFQRKAKKIIRETKQHLSSVRIE